MGGLVDAQPKEGTLQLTQRTTRGHPSKLRVPQSRTDTHLHSFFPSAIRLWNQLPSEAPSAETPAAFKNILEGWLGLGASN